MAKITFENMPEAIQVLTEEVSGIKEFLLSGYKLGNQVNTARRYRKIGEASEYCNMPVSTFRSHLAKGDISGSKPGRSWLFSEEDLEEFIWKFKRNTKAGMKKEVEFQLLKNRRP